MWSVDKLQIATPYMLRRDGVLLSCGIRHPYIKYLIDHDNRQQIKELFELEPGWIIWFKHNTIDNMTKQLIIDFLNGVSSNARYFEVAAGTIALFEDWDGIIYGGSGISVEETEKLFVQLNDRVNNEFCRVRTSKLYGIGDSKDIYFMVGSKDGFNWIPNIYNVVNKYKDFIKSVSIYSNVQVFLEDLKVLCINDIDIRNLPIDEFLNLKI